MLRARSGSPVETSTDASSVLVPVSADQGPNAALAASAGVATILNRDGLRPETVTAALASVLEQPEPPQAVRRIAAEMAEMFSPADVVSMLVRAEALHP